MSGTTTVTTLGNGLATSGALSCIAPKVRARYFHDVFSVISDEFFFPPSQEGTHVIVATEVGAVVNGGGVGTSLNSGSFNVVISKGIPSKLNIDGSPLTVYSSSIGANLQAAEVR